MVMDSKMATNIQYYMQYMLTDGQGRTAISLTIQLMQLANTEVKFSMAPLNTLCEFTTLKFLLLATVS